MENWQPFFALDAPAGECLRTGVPGSSRAMVIAVRGKSGCTITGGILSTASKTGEPAFRRRGLTDVFQDPLSLHLKMTRLSTPQMADLTRPDRDCSRGRLQFQICNDPCGCRRRERRADRRHPESESRFARYLCSINRRRRNAQRRKSRKMVSRDAAKRSAEISSKEGILPLATLTFSSMSFTTGTTIAREQF